MRIPGLKILPRFVKELCFSSLCVKFQPTECNISFNFDHFSSLPNYVRGVTCALLMKIVIKAEGGSRAAAQKGSMTHSFTRMGNFILLHLDSPLRLRPSSCHLSLQAAIWALRLELGNKVEI